MCVKHYKMYTVSTATSQIHSHLRKPSPLLPPLHYLATLLSFPAQANAFLTRASTLAPPLCMKEDVPCRHPPANSYPSSLSFCSMRPTLITLNITHSPAVLIPSTLFCYFSFFHHLPIYYMIYFHYIYYLLCIVFLTNRMLAPEG